MPFDTHSPGTPAPFTSAVAQQRAAGGTVPPPRHPAAGDPLWRSFVSGMKWLLILTRDGFAAYGEAMYPGLSYPGEYDDQHTAVAEPEDIWVVYARRQAKAAGVAREVCQARGPCRRPAFKR